LSVERLITQFDMITSTLPSATGRCSISPSRSRGPGPARRAAARRLPADYRNPGPDRILRAPLESGQWPASTSCSLAANASGCIMKPA
jgi:hypothetical protein